MKIKVEKKFKDKYTGKIYKVGDVVEVAEERGAELLSDSRKLVSKVSEDDPKKTATKTATKTAKPKSKKSSK